MRRGDLQLVLLRITDELPNGAFERADEEHRRRDDRESPDEYDDGRRETSVSAESPCDRLVQRIERHGQDERPEQQGQKRREDPVAEEREDAEQPGANQ